MSYQEKVVIGEAVLYLGDCAQLLPMAGEADAMVTDPPYGIDFAHFMKSRGFLL